MENAVVARETKPWKGKTDDTPVPPRIKLKVKANANDICAVCGARVRLGNGDVDHTIAVINGGENAFHNLRYVHKSCHRDKTVRDLKEKATAARKQKHLAGFESPKRGFQKRPKPRPGTIEKIHWIDENGRDRVTFLKH